MVFAQAMRGSFGFDKVKPDEEEGVACHLERGARTDVEAVIQ